MVKDKGESGTERNSTVKHYYKCMGRKKYHTCSKSVVQKDKLENLVNYVGLDDRIRNINSFRLEKNRDYKSFVVDKEATNIFLVTKGKVNAATGWRDNRENREVTGVVTLEKGEFVLYLPGEPFALNTADGVIEHRRLK